MPSSTNPQKPTLPPPQTFDILPLLHELLARIDHDTHTLDQQLQSNSDQEATDLPALYAPLQPLDPKELPAEVLQIKTKIRRALKELEKLPDMDRTVEDQGEEIRELEEKERRQKEVMRRLREWGAEGLGSGAG
ncbi:uncharacterized protein LTR77_003233 [Saxophila tyrrhenica]|uniref:Mediator of RNA polymerase II transcription subunit 9 n=1 Tax=Saxophila tyrrhenica TaxID=1690608 RepID=A0AAV9PHB4_9PEZI|nr:hypothetical protein LTR77_003233 [Saxophila tyrrhenica]